MDDLLFIGTVEFNGWLAIIGIADPQNKLFEKICILPPKEVRKDTLDPKTFQIANMPKKVFLKAAIEPEKALQKINSIIEGRELMSLHPEEDRGLLKQFLKRSDIKTGSCLGKFVRMAGFEKAQDFWCSSRNNSGIYPSGDFDVRWQAHCYLRCLRYMT